MNPNELIVNLVAATSQKACSMAMFPTSPLLSTTIHKHLGTEETRCWTFGRASFLSDIRDRAAQQSCGFSSRDVTNIIKYLVQDLRSSTTKPCCSVQLSNILHKHVKDIISMGAHVALKPVYIIQSWFLSKCARCQFHRH